jgi:hypothetical protein
MLTMIVPYWLDYFYNAYLTLCEQYLYQPQGKSNRYLHGDAPIAVSRVTLFCFNNGIYHCLLWAISLIYGKTIGDIFFLLVLDEISKVLWVSMHDNAG